MKYIYQNWSPVIFMGFYESILFNSDSEYYLNECLQDEDHPEQYEIDFETYTQEVSEYATELLKDYIINDDNIVKNMKFISLYSPRYYNYDTDRLNIEMNINLNKLKAYIKKNKTDFNLYLKDNFTSYDGFISFVENNYTCFKEQYTYDKNRCLNVMIEYYILNQLYGANWQAIKDMDDIFITPYHQELFENNREYQYNNMHEVSAA